MVPADVFGIIRSLELTTKRLLSGGCLTGDNNTKFRGSGFEFNQLRDYQQGDDIRFIDWKSSTRAHKMLIREYIEDRNRTILLFVDVSASTYYGSGISLKADLMVELAGILAFTALYRKDSVGIILFTDRIEVALLPRSGRNHVIHGIKTMVTHTPLSKTTNITSALEYLASLKIKNTLACVISDFTSYLNQELLSIVSKRHELIAFRCSDKQEITFPSAGMLTFEDRETGERVTINAGRTEGMARTLSTWRLNQETIFRAARVDYFDAIVGCPFINELGCFLRQRII
jgi:uncharacterized protein (DUF58 family)